VSVLSARAIFSSESFEGGCLPRSNSAINDCEMPAVAARARCVSLCSLRMTRSRSGEKLKDALLIGRPFAVPGLPSVRVNFLMISAISPSDLVTAMGVGSVPFAQTSDGKSPCPCSTSSNADCRA
jgi:hypothetical protein